MGKIEDVLQQFAAMNLQKYGTHSYSAGYFQSMVAGVLNELSAARQQYWLEMIEEKIQSYKEESNV